MAFVEKSNDFSYECAVSTLSYDEVYHPLLKLIDRYMDMERSNLNRSWLGKEHIKNLYPSYIKHVCTTENIDDNTLGQHYLYQCGRFRSDYLNGYNPLSHMDMFMERVRECVSLPLPRTEYIGKDISIPRPITFTCECKYQPEGIQVRDARSPCPGVIMEYPLNMELKSYNGESASFTLRRYIDTYYIKSACRNLDIATPGYDDESQMRWISDMIEAFKMKIKQKGFTYCP